MATDMTVAKEILNQLGGNKFIAMTGAKHLSATENALHFKLSSTMTRNKCSHVKIVLNSMDTYDITFLKIRAGVIKVVDEVSGIYNDMLKEIVSEKTGLTLSL